MTEDWVRLGDYVVTARVRKGFSSRAAFAEHLASIGHKVTDRTLSKIETGQRVGPSTLAAIEVGLDWKPGSSRTVLSGGEPVQEDQGAQAAAPEDAFPDFVGDDPGFKALWRIPDELLPADEREYAILRLALRRAQHKARTQEAQQHRSDAGGTANRAAGTSF